MPVAILNFSLFIPVNRLEALLNKYNEDIQLYNIFMKLQLLIKILIHFMLTTRTYNNNWLLIK